METLKLFLKKRLRPHFLFPEEMIAQFYRGRSPGFASSFDFLPMRMHSGYNHRQLHSCGDSVGIAPNFPIKLHIVVPL